jgi:ascorbate-specific PTS system EIIC-type component UlaA
MVFERRPLAGREVDHERLWLSVALAGAALVVLWVAAGHEELPRVICPFRHLTGIPCFTCGGTRAVLALTRGDVRAAFLWNPLVAISAIAALAWLVYAAIVTTLRAPRLRVRLAERDRFVFRAAAWTAITGNWVFLILQGR